MIKFKGIPTKQIYDSENYKVYAVHTEDCNVKHSKYGDVTITGNLHELSIGTKYIIFANEENNKYGTSYNVINIKLDKIESEDDIYVFLKDILTFKQASTLYKEYPDIVERIINNNIDDIDFSKLNGIGETIFNKIRMKIEENYYFIDYIVKFENVLTTSMLHKIYKKYTSIEKMNQALINDPYMFFTELSGVGFVTADRLLIKLQKNGKLNNIKYDLMTSKQRCTSCILHCLQQNKENGNTKIKLFELKKMVDHLVPDCSEYFIDCLHDERIYYDVDKAIVAMKSDYDNELYIAETIKNNILADNIWDYDVSKYKNVDGYDLTNEQLKVLKNLCKYKISILNGPAGSGKTATVTAIINMLNDNSKHYKLMSPTGKASQVLSDYTGSKATTIHIGLGYDPTQNEWVINKENPIINSVIIVDEFSMVDVFLLRKLVDGIDFSTCRMLIVGDNNQLNSVGAGNCLHDMIVSSVIPQVTLSKIFRYSDGGLMKAATDVRNGYSCIKKFDGTVIKFGKTKDYIFIKSTNDNIIHNVVEIYKNRLQKGYSPLDISVLTAYNRGAQGSIIINNELQKIANTSYGNKNFIKYGYTTFFAGDIVLQTKNNYKARIHNSKKKAFICNGETGIIKSINNGTIVIKFKQTLVDYKTKDLANVSLGYAMSCHKSQGSQNKIIILVTPSSHTYMLNSNLLYVGLTRTQEQCFHIGDIATICRAVKKKANLQRMTFLKDMLKETCK